jgi:hypothetical protein
MRLKRLLAPLIATIAIVIMPMENIASAPKTNPSSSVSVNGPSEIEKATKSERNVFRLYVGFLVLAALGTAGLTIWLRNSSNRLLDAVNADAAARIAQAGSEAEQARAAAGEAKVHADNLEHETEELKQKNLSIATDLESERATRLSLEASLSPREIPFIEYWDNTTNVDFLKSFSGTKVILQVVPDLEAERAARGIAALLDKIRWVLVKEELTENARDGVTISRSPSPKHSPLEPATQEDIDARHTEDAQFDLLGFLGSYKWVVHIDWARKEELPADTLRIVVGFKPNLYFRKQFSSEFDKWETSDGKEMSALVQRVPDTSSKRRKAIIELTSGEGYTHSPSN